MHDVSRLEEVKYPENMANTDDDFGLGKTQFLNYNKDNFDMNSRSRSDGNFL